MHKSLQTVIDLYMDVEQRSDIDKKVLSALIMASDPILSSEMRPILLICRDCGDYEAVANAMLAITAHSPLKASDCIEVFAGPLIDDFRLDPHYVMGVVLGIFEVGVWLDANWRSPTDFEKAYPKVLLNILTGENRLGDASGHGNQDLSEPFKAPDDQFERRLSKAVKAFTRSHNQNGKRVSGVWWLFGKLAEGLDPDEFAPLARLVTDQLCYSEFGSFATSGRVMAMNALLDKQFPRRDRSER